MFQLGSKLDKNLSGHELLKGRWLRSSGRGGGGWDGRSAEGRPGTRSIFFGRQPAEGRLRPEIIKNAPILLKFGVRNFFHELI